MITVIGDLVVDLLISSDDTNYATDTESTIKTLPGGQANHVAAWINEGGHPCTLIGRIGNDFYGGFLQEDLQKLGVKQSIEKDTVVETGKIAILIDALNGERSMYTDRGANKNLSIDQIKRSEGTIRNSDCLYISGYSLFGETTYEAGLHAQSIAQRYQVPIAFDPSSTYFLEKYNERVMAFLKGVDFFFPNLDEARLLTQEQQPGAIMEKLQSLVKYPVLKMGDNGCLIFDDGKLLHIPAEKVDVMDTTGAGDSFIGTFLATFFRNHELNKAAIQATKIAANTVGQIGGRP